MHMFKVRHMQKYLDDMGSGVCAYAQVLLSLGVSYTNELDQKRALSYLHTWLAQHAKHGPQIANMQHPDDTSQKLSWVIGLFEQAATAAPADPDVQVS